MRSSGKLKILITQPIHEAGIRLLTGKGYEVRIAPDITPVTLTQEIHDASGLLVRTAQISAELIEAGRSLQVISRHGVGYEDIDIIAATRRNIPVCITPRANALPVAEAIPLHCEPTVETQGSRREAKC